MLRERLRGVPGYVWLIERGIFGTAPNTAMAPWYFLPRGEVFSASERWPRADEPRDLIVFARRQDNDDLACAAFDGERFVEVALLHGWTPEGYARLAGYPTLWAWWKAVIDDVAECAER
ncbi:MAG: hypothetical protein R3A52_06450 [Polyangiales bacterium]